MGLVHILLSIVGVFVLAWVILVAIVWLHRPSRALAGPALRMIPDVVRLTRALLADRATPRRVKVALAGLLAYMVSPIDLIPDFIPILGSMDDLVVTALVLRWAGRRVRSSKSAPIGPAPTRASISLVRLLGVRG